MSPVNSMFVCIKKNIYILSANLFLKWPISIIGKMLNIGADNRSTPSYKSLIGMWFPLVQSSPLLHNHQGICLRKSVAIDADVLSHWGCSPELHSEPHPHSHIQMSPHTNCLESMKTLIQRDQQGSTAFATENYWVRLMKKYLGAPEWLTRSAYLCLHWGSFKGF